VPGGLPSVVFWALGKAAFAECYFFTLGKENFKAYFKAVN